MVEFRNQQEPGAMAATDISEDMVGKVGRAVGQIAQIREAYREGLAEMDTEDDKQELAQRAEQAAVQAISNQGLSVTQYNLVVSAADDDPNLEERLLLAAQAD